MNTNKNVLKNEISTQFHFYQNVLVGCYRGTQEFTAQLPCGKLYWYRATSIVLIGNS